MSFLKNIWKSNSKHKKLSEEWALAKTNKENDTELSESQDLDNNQVTFNLKYLGSTPVERASNETVTAEAIKTILRVAKAAGKKLTRVTVAVSLNGIKVTDPEVGKDILEISIYRISYCSADASNNRVFAFIASNPNETIECHAFLCSKRKTAQAVTLTVARAFSMAYEAWRVLPSSTNTEKQTEATQFNPLNQLIDLDDFNEESKLNDITLPRPKGFNKNEWVSFDDDSEAQRWLDTQDQQINLILN